MTFTDLLDDYLEAKRDAEAEVAAKLAAGWTQVWSSPRQIAAVDRARDALNAEFYRVKVPYKGQS